jgi:hypothetical protein
MLTVTSMPLLGPALGQDVEPGQDFDAREGKLSVQTRRQITAVWGVLGTISMAASVYHGYKRNDSLGWALVWGFFGAVAPVVTPVVGIAQGFGKRKRG